MKSRKFLLFILSSFLLSGCDFLDGVMSTFNNLINNKEVEPSQEAKPETDDEEEEETEDDDEGVDYEIPTDKVGEFYGGLVNDNVHVGYEFSASLEAITKPKTGMGEFKIYSFNDSHGAVLETEDEPGLKAFASYYKEKSKEDNTLIFDQGDTWQGTLESNYSYGGIVQDVFNYAGVSLRTVGNHDFDWGLDHLEGTINRTLEDGDYIPCLAANVYDFNNGVTGTTQQSKYGKEYATFILENGIKVGVVGVIGTLMSSICSNRIETVNFTNPINKIKEMSDYLRKTKKCDIVVASTHNGIGYSADELSSISPTTSKRYVDLVLGGHEHSASHYVENDLLFVQSYSHGRSSAITTFTYDFKKKCLVDVPTLETMERLDYSSYSTNVDPVIDEMIDEYLEVVDPIGDEVLSTHFSGYYSTGALATLMEEAIFNKIYTAGYDIDYAITNNARDYFKGTVFTYRDLYRCFPFDNEIVLLEVDRGDYYGYRPSELGPVPSKDNYLLAVIDYMALHQNSYREYDYYPDSQVHSRTIYKDNGEMITYREILKEFLLANPDRQF